MIGSIVTSAADIRWHSTVGKTHTSVGAPLLRWGPGDVVALGGPIGAGKTVLAGRLRASGYEIASFDDLRREVQIDKGLNPNAFHRECVEIAGRLLAQRIAAVRQTGKPVVVEMSYVRVNQLQKLRQITSEPPCAIHGLYVDADLDECLSGAGGRLVPPDPADVRRYHQDWMRMRHLLAKGIPPIEMRSVTVLDRRAVDSAIIDAP